MINDFGSISDWCKELEPEKYRDKNVESHIKYLINRGILKEIKQKNNYSIYQPDEKGAILAQLMIEQSEIANHFELLYNLERDHSKGAFKL